MPDSTNQMLKQINTCCRKEKYYQYNRKSFTSNKQSFKKNNLEDTMMPPIYNYKDSYECQMLIDN